MHRGSSARALAPPPHLLCSLQSIPCFSTRAWYASSGADACNERHSRSARRWALSAVASSHRMRALRPMEQGCETCANVSQLVPRLSKRMPTP